MSWDLSSMVVGAGALIVCHQTWQRCVKPIVTAIEEVAFQCLKARREQRQQEAQIRESLSRRVAPREPLLAQIAQKPPQRANPGLPPGFRSRPVTRANHQGAQIEEITEMSAEQQAFVQIATQAIYDGNGKKRELNAALREFNRLTPGAPAQFTEAFKAVHAQLPSQRPNL